MKKRLQDVTMIWGPVVGKGQLLWPLLMHRLSEHRAMQDQVLKNWCRNKYSLESVKSCLSLWGPLESGMQMGYLGNGCYNG